MDVSNQLHTNLNYSIERMQLCLDAERDSPDEFQSVHPHFIEICVLLLEAVPGDVPRSSQVRKLLQELREVRHAKIMHGLKELDGTAMKVLKWIHVHSSSIIYQ